MPAARLFIVLALLLASAGSAWAEAKAYELIKYRGKAEGLTIAFDFGCGYPEASEVRIKQRRGKSTTFRLFGADEMRFVPLKNRDSDEEVKLDLGLEDNPKDKVNGTYRAGGKTIRFTLTLQDE